MREKLLMRCLWAVRRNVRVPYHIIIINDSKKPLFFKNEEITVINNLERRGLGAARQQCLELVDTEYFTFLDNDVMVLPRSLDVQVETLDHHPELAAVSGLLFSRFKLQEAANFLFENNKVIKIMFDSTKILSHDQNDLFFVDFIPIGHTSFRMEAMKNIKFDSSYKMGYEHWDLFMQLYYAKWKCAVHKKSIFFNLYYESPKEYQTERFSQSLLEASRKHFVEKWGYKPITPKVTRREVIGKLLKGLANSSVLAIYARVMFNYPLIWSTRYHIAETLL